MRLVAINRVPDGTRLARDVHVGRADGIPLLRAGVLMNGRYRRGLQSLGIHAVYIEDIHGTEIIAEPVISQDTRAITTYALDHAFQAARQTMLTGQAVPDEVIDSLGHIVELILGEVQASAHAVRSLADLCSADAYTFQHSVDVTVLGLLIGHHLHLERGWIDHQNQRRHTHREERLVALGAGLLLHDVGKIAIPDEILNKPGRLSPDEWEIVRAHPRTGIALLRGSGVSPLSASVVLRHHERWDGSGYPDGKRGAEIHEMSRIAAVADVYDAITSERPYARARAAADGVRAILSGSGSQFDPAIVELFARLVAPFPAGTEIELADGRRAIVVGVPKRFLDRPRVRVITGPGAPYELALLDEPTVRIKGWDEIAPARAA